MKLKNYQEDIVINTINIVLEEQPGLKTDEAFINDVAAFVLNRIPAKYIMSERGFTRLALAHLINGNGQDEEEKLTDVIEIMALINRGIKVVSERRKAPRTGVPEHAPCLKAPDPGNLEYTHNFPQFFGRVIDRKTQKPVPGACVTLYVDGVKAESAEPGWINPYCTKELTLGMFRFWPAACTAMEEEKTYKVRLEVEHPDYEPFTLEKDIHTTGAFRVYDFIDGGLIVRIEPCVLDPKRS